MLLRVSCNLVQVRNLATGMAQMSSKSSGSLSRSCPCTNSELVTTSMRGDSEVVKLKNVHMGVGKYSSEAPAFINFATPWVYAVTDIDACDGGVYGDTTFTYKPDAIKGVSNARRETLLKMRILLPISGLELSNRR